MHASLGREHQPVHDLHYPCERWPVVEAVSLRGASKVQRELTGSVRLLTDHDPPSRGGPAHPLNVPTRFHPPPNATGLEP
jgi:hypothetical protein